MERTSKELHDGIGSFGREVEAIGARSITLLKDIETTISGVNRLTGQMQADAEFAEKMIEEIKIQNKEIDADNKISSQLEKAQSIIHDLYQELILRRESGRTDSRLSADDGIEEVYSEAIAAAADLQNNLNDLRWQILEHDADLSPVSKSYTDARELIKDLAA